MLERYADGIWIAARPEHRFMGLKLGTRMTVVKLGSGGVLIHSPIPVGPEMQQEIEAIGPVEHIVAPNFFHHLFAGDAATRWPKAMVHAVIGLRGKRPDLRIDADLTETPSPAWPSDLIPIAVPSQLREIVLHHPASRTLISADLLENFHQMDAPFTRLYLKAAGCWQRPGWSRFLRFVYDDRKAARVAIARILGLDFERIVLGHGDPISHDAKAALTKGLAWL